MTVALHLLAYWLAPSLVAVWKDPSALAFALVIAEPRTERKPANPPPAPRRTAARLPPALTEAPVAPSISIGDQELAGLGDDAAMRAAINTALIESTVSLPPLQAADGGTPDGAIPADAAAEPRFELPSRVSIAYQARSSITDGVAHYSWKRTGNKYETESTVQATGFFVSMFAGVMHQVSEGELSPAGLAPVQFRFRRGDSAPETASFARDSGELRLTRNGNMRTLPLPAAIQDTQSFVFQLAYLLAQGRDPGKTLDVLVTNARKVYRYRFRQADVGPVETEMGTVQAVHLVSEAAEKEDVYEVWLSPAHHNLPVKLRFHAGRFPIELIAASIRSTP